MRTHAEIMADLETAKKAAADLNLRSVEARDVTAAHEDAARRLNTLIREHTDTWRARGASNAADDHAEWVLFSLRDLDGTLISAWVS